MKKEERIKQLKRRGVILGLLGAGAAVGIGSHAIKSASKNDNTTQTEITNEATTEEVTSEDIVIKEEDRIDEIIKKYNSVSGKNLSRENLGIKDVGTTWCIYEETNENGDKIYYSDATISGELTSSSKYIDEDDISNLYYLIDTTENIPIAGICVIKHDKNNSTIENVIVKSYVSNDKIVHHYDENKYISLDTSLLELDVLHSYFEERIDYLDNQKGNSLK